MCSYTISELEALTEVFCWIGVDFDDVFLKYLLHFSESFHVVPGIDYEEAADGH